MTSSYVKYLRFAVVALVVSFVSAANAQIQMGSTESQLNQNIKLRNVSNLQFKPSRDTTSSLFSPLSSSDATSSRMFASLYNQLERVPFGPTIDISFETMDEVFDFKELKLDFSATKIVFVGENNEETTSSLPATTYTSSFVDSDGIAQTVVATINPIDNEYMIHVMREDKPTLILQPFGFFKRGIANQPTLAAKVKSMSPSSHISYYSDEFEVLGLGDESPCEATSSKNNTNIVQGLNSSGLSSSTISSESVVSRSLKGLVNFPNCHGNGQRVIAFNTGIVVDYATIAYYGDVASINTFIQQINTVNSMVYVAQFNISWKVQELRFETTNSQTDGKSWNAPCQGLPGQLSSFRSWLSAQSLSSKYGAWQLYTICPTTTVGTLGYATIETLCSSSAVSVSRPYLNSGMNTIAHEVGHNFGSNHAWTYVSGAAQGSVGGIMDYNTNGYLLPSHPKSPNEYGFHETSQEPICSYLKKVVRGQNIGGATACFSEVSDSNPVCGNGIIEHGEECDSSDNTLNCCKNCKLVKGATCLKEDACCKDCQAQTSDTSCTPPGGTTPTGVCGYSGSAGCSSLSFPCVSTTMNGCIIRCPNENYIRTAPVGSTCKVNPSDTYATGRCVNVSNQRTCQPVVYGWETRVGAVCDCSAPTENVFLTYTFFCSDLVDKSTVAADLCSKLPLPTTNTFDCNFVCKGSLSPKPVPPTPTPNPKPDDGDGDGSDNGSDGGSTSSALASSLNSFITIMTFFVIIASLTY